jgi:hypothetical protein
VRHWRIVEHALLYLYRKNEQGDLTPAQIRTLAKIVREEFG